MNVPPTLRTGGSCLWWLAGSTSGGFTPDEVGSVLCGIRLGYPRSTVFRRQGCGCGSHLATASAAFLRVVGGRRRSSCCGRQVRSPGRHDGNAPRYPGAPPAWCRGRGASPPPPLPPRVWYLCGRGAHAVWRAARFHRRSAVVTATCSVGREAPLRGDAANPGVPGLPQRRAASVWFVFLFYLSPGGRRAVDFLSRRDCSLPPAIKCRGMFVEGTSGGHEGRMRSKGLVSYGVWLRGLGA